MGVTLSSLSQVRSLMVWFMPGGSTRQMEDTGVLNFGPRGCSAPRPTSNGSGALAQAPWLRCPGSGALAHDDVKYWSGEHIHEHLARRLCRRPYAHRELLVIGLLHEFDLESRRRPIEHWSW